MQAQTFIAAIAYAAQALDERKEEVNRLNVFPVPDGDTGTNMSLTLAAVVGELEQLGANTTLAALRKAVTHGSLMGARGNSGVITSQILRGICEGMDGADTFDANSIARALAKAVEVAFNAVRKPVEGTILTVVRDSADAAYIAAEQGLSSIEALEFIVKEAFESVSRTPDLLDILRENNVVDAGGFGLAILMEGFTAALAGKSAVVPPSTHLAQGAPRVAIEQINDWEGSDYLYCTEFLLRSESIDPEEALNFLATQGDCELLVGAHPDFKVHVHTNEPGNVLNYMTKQGQVAEVHIHNMRLQSEERSLDIVQDVPVSSTASGEPRRYSYVAVCSGSGTVQILKSLGVDHVILGGQTMNPSTADFVEAIASVKGQNVILFPNNSNILMAALAASQIADKPTKVVPTKSVPQCFTAMFEADDGADFDAMVEAMEAVIAQVKTIEITQAIKDAKAANGQAIHTGDVLGIVGGNIDIVGSSIEDVAIEAIAEVATGADTLTLLAGQDYQHELFETFVARVEGQFPDLEIDAQRGEQPLYPLIAAVE